MSMEYLRLAAVIICVAATVLIPTLTGAALGGGEKWWVGAREGILLTCLIALMLAVVGFWMWLWGICG